MRRGATRRTHSWLFPGPHPAPLCVQCSARCAPWRPTGAMLHVREPKRGRARGDVKAGLKERRQEEQKRSELASKLGLSQLQEWTFERDFFRRTPTHPRAAFLLRRLGRGRDARGTLAETLQCTHAYPPARARTREKTLASTHTHTHIHTRSSLKPHPATAPSGRLSLSERLLTKCWTY